MTEFKTRIAAKREVLSTVNAYPWQEELMGLSRKAIGRWLNQNRHARELDCASILKEISARLRFLANESQQQITEEYAHTYQEVVDLTEDLSEQLSSIFSE